MNEQQLEAVLSRHGTRRENLIPILQEIQEACEYLPEEGIRAVAERLGMRPAGVYAVASFYESFVFKRSGKYVLRLCDGTTCHSRAPGSCWRRFTKSWVSPPRTTPPRTA